MEQPPKPKFPPGANPLVHFPLLPLHKIMKDLTAGEMVELSMLDHETKTGVQDMLDTRNPVQKSFRLTFFEECSEIKMECNLPKHNFSWMFINQSNMAKGWGNIHRTPNSFIYGISDGEQVKSAVEQLQRIREIFPGGINQLAIGTKIFSPWRKTKKIVRELVKLNEVEKLCIHGDNRASAHCDVLLNKITVSKELIVCCFPGRGGLEFQRLAFIPKVHIGIPLSTRPAEILAAAGETTHFEMTEVPLTLCNNLLLLWLKSDNCVIDRLTLNCDRQVTIAKNEPICKLFRGLEHVKGTADIDYVVKGTMPGMGRGTCPFWYMSDNGIELHRDDGAIATVFYMRYSEDRTFTMKVEYPGKPTHAQQMPTVFEQYAWDKATFDVDARNTRFAQTAFKNTEKWVKENEKTMDAEELKRFNRFKTQEEVEMISTVIKNETLRRKVDNLRMEMRQFDGLEKRRDGGFFRLAKKVKNE